MPSESAFMIGGGDIQAEALIQGLRAAGIKDERVLSAISRTPRDLFVPPTFGSHAWDNVALPIGSGQTISQPWIVARMTEALALTGWEKVLEIGTGSGYQTAILARLCRRVFTIERHKELLKEADQRFARLRLGNVTSRFGDGTKGWPEPAPFDRIIITAAAAQLPSAILDLLADDGILVAPIGHEWREQILTAIRRRGAALIYDNICAVRFVPLVAGLPRRVHQAFSELPVQGGTQPVTTLEPGNIALL